RTLYCLKAATGTLVWKHVLCGNPDDANCNQDDNDPALIFSSAVLTGGVGVVGGRGGSAAGARGGIGGGWAARRGDRGAVWGGAGRLRGVDQFLDERGTRAGDRRERVLGGMTRGGGNVWPTGGVGEAAGLFFSAPGDAKGEAPPPYHEAVLALDIATGRVVWI